MSAAPQKQKPKRGNAMLTLAYAVLIVAGTLTLLPTTLVLMVGLLPTAVAIFVDNSRDRLAGLTVGCMNVAGIVPPLMSLWEKGHSVENALHILTQPFMLLVMYGGAALGLVLYINTPLMVSGLLRRQAIFRNKAIDRQCQELREDWGSEVEGVQVDD